MNVEINENKNKPKDQHLYNKYNLQNNITQNLYNLTKDIKYYFILEASLLKTAKINIEMSLSSHLTYNYINVQEIKDKENIGVYSSGNTYNLNGIIRDGILYKFNPINYTVTHPSSNYLFVTFIPKYNVSFFSIRVSLRGIIYKLSISSSYLNLYVNPDEIYYFMIESNKNYKSLNISFKGDNYINHLDYYEFVNNFSSVQFYNSFRLINKRYNYNKMISSLLYNFTSFNKKEKAIIFKLEPSNFDYLEVQYDFFYIFNDILKIDNQRQTFSLVKGNEYNFKTYSSSKKIKIEIILKYEYTDILPFNYFIIKEYSSSSYYNLLQTSEKSFTREVKNGEIIYACNHYLSYTFGYLLIQILPYENIPNFNIKLNNIYNYNNNDNTQKNKYSYSNNKRKNKLFIITMIVVPILIVVIIIIIICYKCKKNSHNLDELNLDKLNQNNDIYSINDSLKNNEGEQPEQPYNNNKHEDFQSYQEINDFSYNKNNSNDYMFPYDQPYDWQNRNDQQYYNSPNNNQNLGNYTIN